MAACFRLFDVLLWDILLWLPVKSLLRFRCVSRALRNHIDSPLFVELHMHASNATYDLVLLGGFCKIGLIDCSTAAAFTNPLIYYAHWPEFTNSVRESYTSSCRELCARCSDDCFSRFCSCNGLICFLDASEVAWLWNPSTGKHRSIPPGEYRTNDFRDYVFGLGHDVSSNDYLIVRIFGSKRGNDPSKVEVYSLNESCWTPLADIPYCIDIPLQGNKCPTLSNGGLHWVGRSLSSNERPRTIIGFDVASRNFREIPLPDTLRYDSHIINILVLDGCLCITSSPSSFHQVWVMREYGVSESWEEVLSDTRELKNLLSFSKKGELIAEKSTGTGLCLHDLKNQSSRDLEIKNFEYKPRWSGVSFFETLVPL